MTRISIVVATCQTKRYDNVISLLDCIAAQTYGDVEVVVVIDENRPLYEKICDYRRDHDKRGKIRVIFNPDNNGLSYDRNLGIINSSGDVVAFIDDDALPEPTWAEHIHKNFEDDPAVGAVVGDIHPAWECQGMEWFPRELYWMISCSYTDTPMTRQEVERGFGVSMAFRKSILEDVGLFDTRLGIQAKRWVGGEDTDMFRKTRCSGYKIMFDPAIVVHHFVSVDRFRLRNIAKRAFGGGLAVSILKRLKRYRMSGSIENRYLEMLLLQFYPGTAVAFARTLSPIHLRKMLCVTTAVLFEGLGYAYGLVTIRRKTLESDLPAIVTAAEKA